MYDSSMIPLTHVTILTLMIRLMEAYEHHE
jgi:hypothetical protein